MATQTPRTIGSPATTARCNDLAKGYLEDALAADDPAVKNYFIRQALQALVIAE